jgi:excisionase family DNA binding protein
VDRLDRDPLWTVRDVAAYLQLTVKGIYSLVEQRRIPVIKVSNRVRFQPQGVVAWVEQRRVVPLDRK